VFPSHKGDPDNAASGQTGWRREEGLLGIATSSERVDERKRGQPEKRVGLQSV